MADRDVQSMTITRSTLLVVTGVGVGLLTLSYVLGVQVGKQSAALRKLSPTGAGEELQVLPVPLNEQLKQLEALGGTKGAPTAPVAPPPSTPEPKADAAAAKPEPPPVKAPEEKAAAPEPEEKGKWTVQLVATTDAAEAKRVAARASSAGFAAKIVTDKGTSKVRLSKQGTKANADALAERLKARGFKAFPIKAD